MSIQRGCNDGDLPGGDAVGERNFYGCMTSPPGKNFRLPQERFREILAQARRGNGHLDLAGTGAGFRG